MSIDADKLRQPVKTRRERVELPQFGEGEYVWVHGLTQLEDTQLDAMNLDDKGSFSVDSAKLHKVRTVAHCLRDDDGNRLLGSADYDIMNSWPAGLVNGLYDKVQELSKANGQAITDLAKN